MGARVVITQATTVAGQIVSYNPQTNIQVNVGTQVSLGCTVKNTGNVRYTFIVGLSVWPKGADINSTDIIRTQREVTLNPGEQSAVQPWVHTFTTDQAGDWLYQFGLWKAKPFVTGNRLDREPSPAKVITVVKQQPANQPPVAKFAMSAQGKTAYENQALQLSMAAGGKLTVQFSAARSTDDKGIASYEWKVDGTTVSHSRDFSWEFDQFKTYQIFLTVTDTDGATNSVGARVVITQASVSRERLVNGSFSSGATGWTIWGDFWAGTNYSHYHTSPGYAAGGVDSAGRPENNAVGGMYQTVTVPSGATKATLSFWYNITSQETGSTGHDFLNVTIEDAAGKYLGPVVFLSNRNQTSLGTYRQITVDMTPYKGHVIRINFLATTNDSNPTVFRIDDVSLISDG